MTSTGTLTSSGGLHQNEPRPDRSQRPAILQYLTRALLNLLTPTNSMDECAREIANFNQLGKNPRWLRSVGNLTVVLTCQSSLQASESPKEHELGRYCRLVGGVDDLGVPCTNEIIAVLVGVWPATSCWRSFKQRPALNSAFCSRATISSSLSSF